MYKKQYIDESVGLFYMSVVKTGIAVRSALGTVSAETGRVDQYCRNGAGIPLPTSDPLLSLIKSLTSFYFFHRPV
jgi:hypothetical protein